MLKDWGENGPERS